MKKISGLLFACLSGYASAETIQEILGNTFADALVTILQEITSASAGVSDALTSGALLLLAACVGFKMVSALIIGLMDNDLVDSVQEFFSALIIGGVLVIAINNWAGIRNVVGTAQQELVSVVSSVVGVPYDTSNPSSIGETAKGFGNIIGSFQEKAQCQILGGDGCTAGQNANSESLMSNIITGIVALLILCVTEIIMMVSMVVVLGFLIIGHFSQNIALGFGVILVAVYPVMPMWTFNTIGVVAGAILYQAVAMFSIGAMVKMMNGVLQSRIDGLMTNEALIPNMLAISTVSGLMLLALPTFQSAAMALVGGASIDFSRFRGMSNKSTPLGKSEGGTAAPAAAKINTPTPMAAAGGGAPMLAAPKSGGVAPFAGGGKSGGVTPFGSSGPSGVGDVAKHSGIGGASGGSSGKASSPRNSGGSGGSDGGVGASSTGSRVPSSSEVSAMVKNGAGNAKSQAEFNKEAKRVQQKLHPDKHGGSPEAAERFKEARQQLQSVATSKGYSMRR